MGFASAWISGRAIFPEFIGEQPGSRTGIIIVIPSCDEKGIDRVLGSLAECETPACSTEVIVVVNAAEDAAQEIHRANDLTLENIEAWKRKNKNSFFRLYSFMPQTKGIRGWGVGLARKTGMDEAVRRFDIIGRPEGIILCLDADCTVRKDYLKKVHDDFFMVKQKHACSIYFEHPLDGTEFSRQVYSSIAQYELHLRYYLQALVFTGFPDAFHTVGSATAVRALAYVRAGGMNRKQAGEDFYFIQKLIPSGGYFALNSTTVYPSPRPSSRVPFGTGASISKLTGQTNGELLTYNTDAFAELKTLFGLTEDLWNATRFTFYSLYDSLPPGIRSFIDETEFSSEILQIQNNTSGYKAFRKRFFTWFNMFRIVKFLNHVHTGIYTKKPVSVSAAELLEITGIKQDLSGITDLLEFYRSLERGV
jgi:hypothetical protein